MKEEAGKLSNQPEGAAKPPYRVNFAGRPFVTFDRNLRITDCSHEVADLIKVSKEELLASDPLADKQNSGFRKTAEETLSSGISHYVGRLIVCGRAIPPGLSFVLIPLETLMHEAVGIICFLVPDLALDTEPGAAPGAKSEPAAVSAEKTPAKQPDLFNSKEPEPQAAVTGSRAKLGTHRYQQLLMSLPTGVALLDEKGFIFEINEVMANIMQKRKQDFDKAYNIHESAIMQHTGVAALFDACILDKAEKYGEMLHQVTGSSDTKFLQYSFVPIVADGSIELVVLNVMDSSVLKKVEQESKQQAEFLNLVVNSLRIQFFVKDEQHRWIMLNDAACEMMGKPREFLLGKTDYDIFPREQADEFWAKDDLVFAEGFNINEESITWSDGSVRTIITSKQLHVEQNGRKLIVGTNMDITEIKLKEKALTESEAKYRYLFDNANDFIITMDLDGNITNANARLLKEMDMSIEEFCAHNIKDFIKPGDEHKYMELAAKVKNNMPLDAVEFDAYDARKNLRTYNVRISLMHQDKAPVGVQCVFSDITENKKAQMQLMQYSAELQSVNATKDKFFSIIAHDLRNPYSSLIGFTELMLEDLGKLTLDEMREYLRLIRNSAKNSLNLLENLLAWSRLQTNRMPFDQQKLMLYNIVEEVVDVLNSLAYRKKIDISVMVEPNICLHADKNMLITILHNLVMNAVKFTPIGGNIYITNSVPAYDQEKEKTFVSISVADTGVGIEEKVQARLFMTEQPESRPGTEKEQGTGLGLILAKEMTERHGGRIWVKSKPSEGAVFTFMMPVYQEAE